MAVFVIGALLHCNPDHRVCGDARGESKAAASDSGPVSGNSSGESPAGDDDCSCAFCLYVGFNATSSTAQTLLSGNVYLNPESFTLGQFSLEIFRPPLSLS